VPWFGGAYASLDEDAALAARAWDLESLGLWYREFIAGNAEARPIDPVVRFAATVDLVHEWRHVPFMDPELPSDLLPANWSGRRATELFHEHRKDWSEGSQAWFSDLEAQSGFRR
jgi:phenylacetic acid degradation operon negative regulatory protein